MQGAGSTVTLASGNYTLRERLAASAYGVLWRADGACGPVALKLVNADQMAQAHEAQRGCWRASAQNEISFLRSLAPWDARHIVRLIDSGEHDGLPAMALELLDGDLAGQAIDTIGFGRALDWIGQLNQALGKVHAGGWRYLDLKPANVLLDKSRGIVKLADFGTNRALDDAAAHTYTGTASWQAPEQFFPDAGQRYASDTRSDYFSLGALFYYLVMGGQLLRYSVVCGAAYREHGRGGAAQVRAQHGGALPPVLCADEEAAFARRGGRHALPLLRALLAADSFQRPRHALDISRAIAAIRAAGALPLRRAA